MPQVIYITCTMAAWDFADIYTRNPRACGPRALDVYISKIPRSHGITYIRAKGSPIFTRSDTSCNNSTYTVHTTDCTVFST